MTFTLTDLDKVLYWVKVVPDAEPNADGEWCTLFMHPRYANNYDYVNSILPRGQHAVAVTRRKPQ